MVERVNAYSLANLLLIQLRSRCPALCACVHRCVRQVQQRAKASVLFFPPLFISLRAFFSFFFWLYRVIRSVLVKSLLPYDHLTSIYFRECLQRHDDHSSGCCTYVFVQRGLLEFRRFCAISIRRSIHVVVDRERRSRPDLSGNTNFLVFPFCFFHLTLFVLSCFAYTNAPPNAPMKCYVFPNPINEESLLLSRWDVSLWENSINRKKKHSLLVLTGAN